MILRFITKRNTNGHRDYLAIDTGRREFCTYSPRMIPEGVEITRKAMREIREACENDKTYCETGGF